MTSHERLAARPHHLSDIDRLRNSGVLPEEARWFTSPERRAAVTARRLGHAGASIVDDFPEQERPERLVDVLESVIQRAVESPEVPVHPGWETANSTCRRVVAALESLEAPDEPVVLVGHGFAWTLLVLPLRQNPPRARTLPT